MLSNSKCQNLDSVTPFMMLPCHCFFKQFNITLKILTFLSNFTGIRPEVKNIKDENTGPTHEHSIVVWLKLFQLFRRRLHLKIKVNYDRWTTDEY